MARSVSIDGLSFHHFKSGTSDSIKARFDDTKCDKTGEFFQEKNCYANPFKPHVCFYLALSCWISLNSERLNKTEKFFLNLKKKPRRASHRFCEQLNEVLNKHIEVARRYL